MEGENQLPRYDDWLRLNAANRRVFRLFLHHHRAQEAATSERWHPLSYLELVRVFRSVYGKLRHRAGFQFLRFYLAGVLQDICGWPGEFDPRYVDPYAVASYLKAIEKGRQS
jgi:hypothetical protein